MVSVQILLFPEIRTTDMLFWLAYLYMTVAYSNGHSTNATIFLK